jgi:hypothetical protein
MITRFDGHIRPVVAREHMLLGIRKIASSKGCQRSNYRGVWFRLKTHLNCVISETPTNQRQFDSRTRELESSRVVRGLRIAKSTDHAASCPNRV